LSGAVAKLAPAAAPANSLVASAGSLIGQGITIYLDQRRYAVLRSMVPTVDPAVQTLGRTVEAALLDIRAQQLAQLPTKALSGSARDRESRAHAPISIDSLTSPKIWRLKCGAQSIRTIRRLCKQSNFVSLTRFCTRNRRERLAVRASVGQPHVVAKIA